MDDRLKETLSAMMDDQADELSVRRLLSRADHEELRGQWQRWQQVRELLHERSSPTDTMDISQRVRSSLTGLATDKPALAGPALARPSSAWPWAAAAMVVFSLVVGFGMGAGWKPAGPGSLQLAGAAEGLTADQPVTPESSDIPEVALQGLDQKQWEQLSRYLLEHAQHSSVGAGQGAMGYARLASASSQGY